MTQNFGPEARGGACSAQLILSESPVLYPYVYRPDIMVVMSQEAYVRFVPELKEGGILIVEQDLVRVSDLSKATQVYSIPATRIAEELGKRMVLNSVMVGFFTAVTNLLEPDAVRKAVADSVPASFRELNLKAFERGLEYGITLRRKPVADQPGAPRGARLDRSSSSPCPNRWSRARGLRVSFPSETTLAVRGGAQILEFCCAQRAIALRQLLSRESLVAR